MRYSAHNGERWQQCWPTLKNQAKEQNETLVFIDESSFHLCSHHTKTLAPVGQTPVVKGKRGQTPCFMVTGAVFPEGWTYFSWTTKHVTGDTVVKFLKKLLRYWPGKLRVIWDNAPKAVQSWLSTPEVQRRLALEALPPYAPELNPAEALCSWLKRQRANLAFKDGLALA